MKTSRVTTRFSNLTIGSFAVLIGAIILYLYFLNMSVIQVVMRTQYISEQRTLSAEIAQLESEYIESQHIIASRIALLDNGGYDAEKFFVSREKPSLVLVEN